MWPDVQLVVVEGRGCNRFLRSWAGRFDHRRIISVSSIYDHLAAHRNRVFKWFRDECTLPWLLTVDDDVVPLPETDEVLRAEGDIVAARVWGRSGEEMHPEAFSMACVKVHRRVVEAVPPPWFEFTYTQDGVAQVRCECLNFANKAAEQGFAFRKVGAVGHRFPMVVAPGEDGPRFLFDHEINQMMKEHQ